MIKKSIEKLIDLDEMKKDGRWEVKSKKEQSKLEKIYKKLHKNLWGIRNIKELPGVLIVIDSNFEEIAVYEARKLNIPIVGIVDTNADPEGISYPVPGNDDAIRSIKLFTTKFGEAVKQGMEKRQANAISAEEQAEKESAEGVEGVEGEEGEETPPAEETSTVEETVEAEETAEVEKIEEVEEVMTAEEETVAVEEAPYPEVEDSVSPGSPGDEENIKNSNKIEDKTDNKEEITQGE